MKFAISYESKMDYEDDFSEPMSIMIEAENSYEATEKTKRVFHKCFGKDAEIWILGIASEVE